MKSIFSRCLSVMVLLGLSSTAQAYVYCEDYVAEILPNINDGMVWFELEDGTKIKALDGSPGLQNNLSVALSALMANKKVRVALNDGQSCGVNSQTNWTYIITFNQN